MMAGSPEAVLRSPAGHRSRLADSSVVREAAPLAGAIGAYGVLSAFLSTTTSLFLTTAVHVAPLLIGLFFAGRGVVSIALNLGVGSISDRLPDRRLLVVIAGAGGAVGGVCFAVLRDYVAVLLSGVVCFSTASGRCTWLSAACRS